MSLKWVAARALETGSYNYATSAEDSPATRSLAARISIVHDRALDALLPATLAADVELRTAAGSERVAHWRATDADPTTPGPRARTLNPDEAALEAKFKALAGDARGSLDELLAVLDA
jgi:2-methylcitrate dehydratase PrpD